MQIDEDVKMEIASTRATRTNVENQNTRDEIEDAHESVKQVSLFALIKAFLHIHYKVCYDFLFEVCKLAAIRISAVILR